MSNKILFESPNNYRFTFIDLFAGIGGFRIALQSLGGKCVYSSEFDENAQKTYLFNYGDIPYGDITEEKNKEKIPIEFDILCGGFPCQPFSIAGRRMGFEDTRGTLFFEVADIIRKRHPKVVFLENVKNLKTHDNGNTFKVIKDTLEELGYFVYDKVMNACEYANVPQNRERIFIVAFNKSKVEKYEEFVFPNKIELKISIRDCIDESINNPKFFYTSEMKHYDELVKSVKSMDTLYQWRRAYVRENKSNLCPTLTANMGTGGHNVPLILTDFGIRKITPRECLNFQGYPKEFEYPNNISMSACYKQAGNTVVVPLIERITEQIIKVL